MNNFQGVIIKESLNDKSVLSRAKILSIKIEKVTAKYKTPWVENWTMHTVEIPENVVSEVAEKINWERE